MRSSFKGLAWSLAPLVVLSLDPALAQYGAKDGEWHSYGGDVGSTKYSPLDQIGPDNFERLEIVWRWRTADAFLGKDESGGEWWADHRVIFKALNEEKPDRWRAGRPPFIRNLKATPLMIGGRLFLNTPISQGVAVDARSGETMWIYNPKSYEAGTTTMSVIWNQRGVAYWSEGEEERVFWGTGDGYLISVDAQTGRPDPDFGEGGRVDLMKDLPRAIRGEKDYLGALLYSMQSPPIVVRDVVITGASIADRRIKKEAVPGWVRGWDVRTGEMRWVFRTVPQAGDEGVETWGDDSWKYSGNANVWSMMSGDEELGYVYLPIGTATNDFYGIHRPGDNLYSESLVCVNVETGEKVWHFQFVHHGLWDYDLPAAPNLVDITVDGRKIKAIAQITKQGETFVFDRATGEPVWPIVEKPVPQETIEGDVASPTQPFPTKPPPFEYQGVEIDDLIDFTPELRELAAEAVSQFKIGPMFTPPTLAVPGGTQGTIMRPSAGGGANWSGAAIDPETGLLYVPSRNSFSVIHFYEPDPEKGGTLKYTHGGRGARPTMPDRLPLFKPPYTRMTAIDLNRGEHSWMQPIGEGAEVKSHRLLEGLDLPDLGGDRYTGPLLTKTLLIHGQSAGEEYGGHHLVARDKVTGEIVASVELPSMGLGTPMTYVLDGRQYIVLTLAGSVPEMVALALPEAAAGE